MTEGRFLFSCLQDERRKCPVSMKVCVAGWAHTSSRLCVCVLGVAHSKETTPQLQWLRTNHWPLCWEVGCLSRLSGGEREGRFLHDSNLVDPASSHTLV